MKEKALHLHSKAGFTLVEMSIVLVVIGLLAGGVMAGKNLIRAAELRSVVNEYDLYTKAVITFRDRYGELPGDMSNATSVWGTAVNCPGTSAQGSTDALTCNGNGNGMIEYGVATGNEWFRFWQQLANAGLIEGIYSGVPGPATTYQALVGSNVPKSKLSFSGWTTRWLGSFGDAWFYTMDYKNTLIFGAESGNNQTFNQIISAAEIGSMDTKIDDGKPGYGKMISIWWDTCTDATGTTDLDSVYLLSDQGNHCSIAFANVF